LKVESLELRGNSQQREEVISDQKTRKGLHRVHRGHRVRREEKRRGKGERGSGVNLGYGDELV
jgi:hypothetical protein